MGFLVFLLLLFSLLLRSAAAQSPSMDPVLPVGSMGSPYPDPDGILNGFCTLCASTVCGHLPNVPIRQPSIQFTANTFLDHHEWLTLFSPRSPPVDPELDQYTSPQHIGADTVQHLEDDATTIQQGTIQAWNWDTYNVGDRTEPPVPAPQHPLRRIPKKYNGFPCDYEGCTRVFSRHCDLRRHQKTHLERSERPHKCLGCSEAFLYPKDLKRHQKTRHRSNSAQPIFYCRVDGCSADAFTRQDNLKRHMRNKHKEVALITA